MAEVETVLLFKNLAFTVLVPGFVAVYAPLRIASGGPYTQANPEPICVSGPHHVTIAGLPNGHTYFGVATMVDLAGNESVYSPEFSFTTGP